MTSITLNISRLLSFYAATTSQSLHTIYQDSLQGYLYLVVGVKLCFCQLARPQFRTSNKACVEPTWKVYMKILSLQLTPRTCTRNTRSDNECAYKEIPKERRRCLSLGCFNFCESQRGTWVVRRGGMTRAEAECEVRLLAT